MKPQHYLDRWHRQIGIGIALPVIIGLLVFAVGIVGFGVWAVTAELSSAAIARGAFIATGQNKIIQHFEGGIVSKILVKEGDVVRLGQTLVNLDNTAAKAQLRRLDLKRYRLLAVQARLEAERRSLDEITFSSTLVEQMVDPEVPVIVESQKTEFIVRKDAIASQIKILEQRQAAIREEVVGIVAQRDSNSSQLDLILQEMKGQDELFKKGLTKLSTMLALKRARAKLQGDRGEAIANIGRAKERITEVDGQIVHLWAKRIEESVAQLRKVETELDDVRERVKAARDILTRLNIKSPVHGIVVKMHHHTTGAVIRAGEDILELLPADEKLLVEAKVQPDDIDRVHKGLKAQLRLVALNQRTTPLVEGTVVYVSADSVKGELPQEVYYLARIEMDEKALAKTQQLKIAPGMPVEVYIQTGQWTFFEYLLKPLMDSVARAFKES